MTASSDPAAEPADPFKVVIAGGGVAALEAVLALRALAGELLGIELVAPGESFSLRALSVAQPFGAEAPREIELAGFCRANRVALTTDTLAEVWDSRQSVLTASGREIHYDALLLALGARQEDALPGARPFRGAHDVTWFAELLGDIERGSVRRLLFAVPEEVRWSLPLYELALLTAERTRGEARPWLELAFITHERAPLEVFGETVSARIAALLADSGVELFTGNVPVRFDGDVLLCEDGRGFEAHRVVTLPGLRVPEIPGVPQGRHGFIGCDPGMRVEGVSSVWAAGDATWLPIKQGGLAAQQAEVAAAGIAAAAGLDVEPVTLRPVLRGALLTGREPQFLRGEAATGASDLSAGPLWWPPVKVAGPRLAPYLWREGSDAPAGPPAGFEDLQPGDVEEHRDAMALALTYADLDAREGELRDALRWLGIAEGLNVTLPPDYVERGRDWRRQLAGAAQPD